MPDLITVSAAAVAKGCSRKAIRSALDRKELRGVRGAAGWAGVRPDDAFNGWQVPPVGRPIDPAAKPDSVRKRGEARRRRAGVAVEAPSAAAAGRPRRRATSGAPTAAEPSDAPTAEATADGSRADG